MLSAILCARNSGTLRRENPSPFTYVDASTKRQPRLLISRRSGGAESTSNGAESAAGLSPEGRSAADCCIGRSQTWSSSLAAGFCSRRGSRSFVKRALSSWVPDDRFWRQAQTGSPCLCPPLARRLPTQIGGRTLRAQRCVCGEYGVSGLARGQQWLRVSSSIGADGQVAHDAQVVAYSWPPRMCRETHGSSPTTHLSWPGWM
jgi:hypothetical protein